MSDLSTPNGDTPDTASRKEDERLPRPLKTPASARTETRAQARDEALDPGKVRDNLITLHPINRRLPKIRTAPIKAALLLIYEVVELRRPGCAFAGEWRFGKTNALALIADLLPQMISNIFIMRMTATKRVKVTNGMVYGDLLKAVGKSTKGTELERFDRFVNHVVSGCLASNGNRFVLFMDEGQNWREDEFTILRDVGNHLLLHHEIDVVTIVFGDPQLVELSDQFRSTRRDLSSRFLRRPFQFPGLVKEEELTEFLGQLDDPQSCEFPAGTGLSCTEFFLPKAFEGGFRLAHEGPAAWSALKNKAEALGKDVLHVGMSAVTDVVKTFLLKERLEDYAGYRPAPDAWSLAVDASEFVEALV